MKYINKAIALSFSLIFIFSIGCSPDDPLIDTNGVSWSSLIVYDGANNLSVVDFPAKSTQTSVLLPNSVFQNPDLKIGYFRDKIYVLSPTSNVMYIVKDKSFIIEDTIDFTALQLQPNAITFANATTAYISFKNAPIIGVFDVTVNRMVSQVALESPAKDISSFENQVYAVCPKSNSVSIIDTRTNKIVEVIGTHDAPTFIGIDIDNKMVLVLCTGNGKTSDTLQNPTEKTRMKLAYISPATNSLVAQTDMIVTQANPDGAIPTSFAVTERYRAYITTNQGLVRVNTFSRSAAVRVSQIVYSTVQYNLRRGELTLLQHRTSGSTVTTAERLTGATLETHVFSNKIRYIYPI
jgi:YVTN family beta-propeller protein